MNPHRQLHPVKKKKKAAGTFPDSLSCITCKKFISEHERPFAGKGY